MGGLLARPCDACGKPIGGGYSHCPRCNVYLCFPCSIALMYFTREYPQRCPMCGEEFPE